MLNCIKEYSADLIGGKANPESWKSLRQAYFESTYSIFLAIILNKLYRDETQRQPYLEAALSYNLTDNDCHSSAHHTYQPVLTIAPG